MKNREFDNALRDFTQDSKLPYDPLQWERMAQRLEAHERTLNPLPARRIIAFYPALATVAAACLLIIAAWYLSKSPSENQIAPQQSITQNAAPIAPSQTPDEHQTIPAGEPQKRVPAERPPHAEQDNSGKLPQRQLAAAAEVNIPTPPTITDSTSADNALNKPTKPEQIARVYPSISSLPKPEQDEAENKSHEPRKLAFGVNGGYNIGSQKNNFTVGVNVKRRLGSRLHLETGLALVSGSYETFSQGRFMNMGTGAVATKSVERATNRLLYLQAAPSLNYRVYRGLSAGGGVDAQRLLGNNAEIVSVNSMGDETTQPQWDFGLTARMDVQIVKKLRAGMMYRESVGSISKSAADAAGRNYLLLQLSYTIY